MALVIENGSIVSNANSYCTVEETRAYLNVRLTVETSATDNDIEVALVKACDYLETFANFKGDKVDPEQSLNFPRANIILGVNPVSETTIPTNVKRAQMQLALHVLEGVDLNPITTGQFVVKEKIGPIETQYSERLNTDNTPNLPLVDAMLFPYISPLKPSTSGSGGFGFLSVTRV